MSFTQEQLQLQAHIEANFTGLVSDPAHWAESNIFTVAQLNRCMDISLYSDLHKDVYGVRPRFNFNEWSDERLATEIAQLSDEITLQLAEERAHEAAEAERKKPRYCCRQCHTPINAKGKPLSTTAFEQAGGAKAHINATPIGGKGCCLFGQRLS